MREWEFEKLKADYNRTSRAADALQIKVNAYNAEQQSRSRRGACGAPQAYDSDNDGYR